MDEPKQDDPDQNPENGPEANSERTPESAPDSKPEAKPKVPPSGKAFDIFSPGKTTPSASARPIIVSHKAMAKDTTVTGNQEVIKQDNKEAGAPPAEEHTKLLDTHQKVNLQPVGNMPEDDSAGEHHDYQEQEHAAPTESMPPNTPEYDHPLESKPPDHAEQQYDKVPDTPPESQQHDNEIKHAETAPAFSPPEHTDSVSSAHEQDELLLPDHTGGGYNAPVQSSDEQFNQFVVSHHRSARQKTLKKVGIIVAVVFVVGATIVFAVWKHSI